MVWAGGERQGAAVPQRGITEGATMMLTSLRARRFYHLVASHEKNGFPMRLLIACKPCFGQALAHVKSVRCERSSFLDPI
jgi:hypothetical protein